MSRSPTARLQKLKALNRTYTRSKSRTKIWKGMLEWDKPLREQPAILKALNVDPNAPAKLNGIDPAWSGQELHDNLLKGKTNLRGT